MIEIHDLLFIENHITDAEEKQFILVAIVIH
jgi:hypothetical protein